MTHFEVYLDSVGEYRWRLVASNNRIVAWSEGYSAKQGAVDSVNWVKKLAATSPLEI